MRITLLIHAMGPGGAERVMAQLANRLADRGHEVSLVTLSAKGERSFYPLGVNVRQVALGLNQSPRHKGKIWVLDQVTRLVCGLRDHLQAQAPDVVLAFIDTTNIFAILATAGLRIPVVVSERSDPGATPLKSIWKIGRSLTYPFASALIVQSAEVRNWFPPWVRRIARVIPNPVVSPFLNPSLRGPATNHRRIIAVGRMSREKGFDLLLEAFAPLAARFPLWTLDIWGEGQLLGELEALRDRLGLKERVHFPGLTNDIYARYSEAEIFVLSSRFEGFPNALCEAMASGLAVIATSCSGGVRDIVQAGKNGILIAPGDVATLSEALATLMDDEDLRGVLGHHAQGIVTRFHIESVMDLWEGCLEEAKRGAE